MTNQSTTLKAVYKIVEYTREDYGDKNIHLRENHNINLELKSVEDWHTVAKLADIKNYAIFKYDVDAKGYTSHREERVFETAELKQWEVILNKQRERNEKELDEAIERVNSLPKKVTVYKLENLVVIATRTDWTKGYGGSDVKYRLDFKLEGKDFGSAWHGYQSEGYGKGRKILKKKFAQDVYQATHLKEYSQQGWNEWKETLKNLPIDYVEKYGEIIEKVYENLEKYQESIIRARNGE